MPKLALRPVLAACVTAMAIVIAGCGAPVPNVAPPKVSQSPVPTTSPDNRGAIRPLARPTGCTSTALTSDAMTQAVAAATPGSKICLFGDMGNVRLTVDQSGTAQAPIQVMGDGQTAVHGITVQADYVTISGINSMNAEAPGISLNGHHITVENSTSIAPRKNDGDAVRFWGSDITIRHNTMRNTRNIKAHADCMQTFATDEENPASQRILIDSNRCEDIDNTCLIAEGPNSKAGDGSGVGATTDIRFINNYCDNRAAQALQIDDVQNVVFSNNEIAGPIHHAIALQNKSTGAAVSGNKLKNKSIKFEVGIDDSSRPGYHGPDPGGDP
ncbi:MAG: right-handed parallel beta-helix repeat-containing protein [Pseudonocardia sp.]|nr:right-handed parallel beta-helix repeat-containing protein [Pseudonocardia sp.]MBO0871882.1 right-handed parallel beta-helix repeat-containing protein [Pseudonocardia sp.]